MNLIPQKRHRRGLSAKDRVRLWDKMMRRIDNRAKSHPVESAIRARIAAGVERTSIHVGSLVDTPSSTPALWSAADFMQQ